MTISAPKQITWIISVVLGVLALLGKYGIIVALAPYAFTLAIVGLVLLALGCLLAGL